jgi:hypothetical protein
MANGPAESRYGIIDLTPAGKQHTLGNHAGYGQPGESFVQMSDGKECAMGNNSTTWIFWPFIALWNLLALILNLTGRLIAFVLGLAFMGLGILCMLTILGAPAGLVLIILGFLLIIRSLF